jgi:hypothetical protein
MQRIENWIISAGYQVPDSLKNPPYEICRQTCRCETVAYQPYSEYQFQRVQCGLAAPEKPVEMLAEAKWRFLVQQFGMAGLVAQISAVMRVVANHAFGMRIRRSATRQSCISPALT